MTASFGPSAITNLTFSAPTTSIGTIHFNAGAPAYTFTLQAFAAPGGGRILDITGAGVVNNSGNPPTINVAGSGEEFPELDERAILNFRNASTAGNAVVTLTGGGEANFRDTSNAASASVTVSDGILVFRDNATAGNATINVPLREGTVFFRDTSRAGSATININRGIVAFSDGSRAGTATFNVSGAPFEANLIFGRNTSAESAVINLTNDGALNFGNTTGPAGTETTAANARINSNGGFVSFNGNVTAESAVIDNNGGFLGFGLVFNSNVPAPTAANATISNRGGGRLMFDANATAGNSNITNENAEITFGRDTQSGFFPSCAETPTCIASAGTATIVNNAGGVTTFIEDATAAGATLTNNNNGSTNFTEASTAANSRITNNAGGSTTFRDTSTAGNAIITNNNGGSTFFSTLNPSDLIGGTAGNATIINNSGGRTEFFRTSSGGQARFINNLGGVFDISNLSTPGTTAGSIEGHGVFFLGSKLLTVGGTGLSTEVRGSISDGGAGGGTGGALTKVGAGTLMLSGINNYTGSTTVNGGTLLVDGSIASSSSTAVNNGATLGGNGTVGSTTVNSGGTLSPGNASIGTLTVNGNLTFNPGATYLVEVSPTAADRTNVTGRATLAGTVHAVFEPGSYTANTYTILSAGARSGTFDAFNTTGLPSFLTASLNYTATDVLLVTLTSNIAAAAGTTRNQIAVAGALDRAFNGGLGLFPGFAGLNESQIPPALDALSGEVHASTAGVLVDESRYMRGAVLGRLRQASYGGDPRMTSLSLGGPQLAFQDEAPGRGLAYDKSPMLVKASPPVSRGPDTAFWAEGFGAWGKFDGDGNAANLKRDLAGFITGVDAGFGGNWRAGVAAGHTASRNNIEGRGAANVETAHVAAYGGARVGALNLRAGGAYAFHSIDTSRNVAFPGFTDRVTARYDGGTGQIFGEVGYGFAFSQVAVEPFAGAAWVHLSTDAANETGGGAALALAANKFEVGYSTLGIRAASIMPIADGMVLVPRVSAAWQHAFDDVTPTASLAFQSTGAGFVVAGVPIAGDSLLAEAGLDLHIGRNVTLGVSYLGQLASNVQDHAAKGKFSWKF